MILVIDNYDSFTFNLVQMVGTIDSDVLVKRNDSFTLDEIKSLNPSKIIISPGPGKPKDAGLCKDLIKYLGKNIPVLGVCLGHQAIGEVFGGKIIQAKNIVHGKVSKVTHYKDHLFKNIEDNFSATRYHSLVIDPDSLPDSLIITARTDDSDDESEIMGVRHKNYKLFGVQFHPESILTDSGHKLLENFINV